MQLGCIQIYASAHTHRSAFLGLYIMYCSESHGVAYCFAIYEFTSCTAHGVACQYLTLHLFPFHKHYICKCTCMYLKITQNIQWHRQQIEHVVARRLEQALCLLSGVDVEIIGKQARFPPAGEPSWLRCP